MIQAHNISLTFGNQKVFDKLSFIIGEDDKIGLIGRNGSGKTTLLKAINDNSVLDSGKVTINAGKTLAYMPQEVVLSSNLSVLDEALTAFPNLGELQTEAANLEAQIEEDPDQHVLERYAEVMEQLTAFSPEALKAEAKKMLLGLGFSQQKLEDPVSSLSVGWKMRVVLAKLLLQKADFYLFDEPTNHLDLVAKEWFLEFLKSAQFGFLLICHERYFLDELCTKILDLERGKATWYTGNYSDSLEQKEHNHKLLESAYYLQQKEIKEKMAIINKFRASAAKASQAQSMLKQLDKIERIELPPNSKTMSVNFPPMEQSGKIALTVKNLAHSFGSKKIFQNVSFEIERGEKVAIIAPNGVGKTTLFNVLAGNLEKQSGSIEFGYNISTAIFAQDQNQVLNQNKTVLKNIEEIASGSNEQTIRKFLGAFLFGREEVEKKVQVLSGGEKNRVGMVGVLLQKANLLLLDEPTNHLDIPSKETVLKALQSFGGTVLFVSHDRDFVNDLATIIIELTPNGAHFYRGNYDAFAYQKKTAAELLNQPIKEDLPEKKESKPTKNNQAPNNNHKELKKQSAKLEVSVEKLQKKIGGLEHSFANVKYGSEDFRRAEKELKDLKRKLSQAEKEWEEVIAQLQD